MGYRKKYTVEYLDAGQITHSFEADQAPGAGTMYTRAKGGDTHVMRWFSACKRFRVFKVKVYPGALKGSWAMAQSVILLGKPVFEHEDRDACIMWAAMKGDG